MHAVLGEKFNNSIIEMVFEMKKWKEGNEVMETFLLFRFFCRRRPAHVSAKKRRVPFCAPLILHLRKSAEIMCV